MIGATPSVSHKHDFAWRRIWQLTCDCGHVEYRDVRPRRRPSIRRHLRWSEMYTSGLTVAEVAAAEGVSAAAIYDALRRLGVKVRHRGSADPVRNEAIVRRVRDDHLALQAVAAEFGLTKERVRQICARAGVDPRASQAARTAAARLERSRRVCVLHGPYLRGDGTNHTGCHNSIALHPEWKIRDERIAADYAAGMKAADIMAKYGVAPMAIARAIRREGVPKRRPRQGRLGTMAEIRERQRAIRAAIDSGRPRAEIAREFGVSQSYVIGIANGKFGANA